MPETWPYIANIIGHCFIEYGDCSGYKLPKMTMDILCKNMAPLLNEFFGDFSGYQHPKMSMNILYKNMIPLMNEFFVVKLIKFNHNINETKCCLRFSKPK